MLFNPSMATVDQDRALIADLGGAARVAELLGIDKSGGAQRVHNWKTRGIPPAIKVARPDLFMPHLSAARIADPKQCADVTVNPE